MQRKITSVADTFVALFCCAVIGSLLLLSVARSRTTARINACGNNFRQIGLGFHNYHSAYKRLPMGSGGTDTGSIDEPLKGNANRLSGLVGLTPFVEEQGLWEQIANPVIADGVRFPPMGPVPWYDAEKYSPWSQRPKLFVCPEDPDANKFPTTSSIVLNYGDGIYNIGSPYDRDFEQYEKEIAAKRGSFAREKALRFRDFLDGLSNTVFFAESKLNTPVAKDIVGVAKDPSICEVAANKQGTMFWPDGRAMCWADGNLRSTGFQTIMPPNGPSCTSDKGELEGILSASSHHDGGVHVCFTDGRVLFVANTIDTGDLSKPSVAAPTEKAHQYSAAGSKSPYGLWGAVGTRAAKEVVDRDDAAFLQPLPDVDKAAIEKIRKTPLQNFDLADGPTIKGHQVDLVDDKQLIVVGEDGKLKTLLLSELTENVAQQAIQRHKKATEATLAQIEEHLKNGIEMLEKDNLDGFAAAFIDMDAIRDDQREALLEELAAAKELLLDGVSAAYNNVSEAELSGTQVVIPTNLQTMPRLKLKKIKGKWRVR